MTEPTHPDVRGKCPACLRPSLFLGSGGFVTCSHLDCPDPGASSDVLYLADADDIRTVANRLLDHVDEMDPPHLTVSEILTDARRWALQTPGRELSRRWLAWLSPETRAHLDAALKRLTDQHDQQP